MTSSNQRRRQNRRRRQREARQQTQQTTIIAVDQETFTENGGANEQTIQDDNPFHYIQSILDENKELVQDNAYIKISNALMKVHKQVCNPQNELQQEIQRLSASIVRFSLKNNELSEKLRTIYRDLEQQNRKEIDRLIDIIYFKDQAIKILKQKLGNKDDHQPPHITVSTESSSNSHKLIPNSSTTLTWAKFFKEKMLGQRFENEEKRREYMRKLGQEWKKIKITTQSVS